jgi:hypothetical protein
MKLFSRIAKCEYTKVIYTAIVILTIFVSIFTCYVTIRFEDTGLLGILIGAIFAELATYSATYAWKTKSINKTRIILDFINNLPDDVSTKEGIITSMISSMD